MKKTEPPSGISCLFNYSFIRVVTGTDLSKRRLPLMEADSGVPGPKLWLTGCLHGDEIGGTVVIQEVFQRLRGNLIAGKISALPILNPFGFEQVSRDLPFSSEDLNRLFPGDERGSLGQRLTRTIYQRITSDRPALVLDLHNDWRRSVPYALLDYEYENHPDKTLTRRLLELAAALDFPVIIDTEKITGTLSGTLLKSGIAAITLELGEAMTINENNITQGVTAIWKLLLHLGMVRQESSTDLTPAAQKPVRLLYYSQRPLSSTSGILRLAIREGSLVKKGQILGRIYNAFGRVQETLRAERDGMVLGCTDHSLSMPGFPVAAFGIGQKLTTHQITNIN
jgi:uncharacterized protein